MRQIPDTEYDRMLIDRRIVAAIERLRDRDGVVELMMSRGHRIIMRVDFTEGKLFSGESFVDALEAAVKGMEAK